MIIDSFLEDTLMNAAGIDVSKGKSTVAILHPFVEIIILTFDVLHSPKALTKLVSILKTLGRRHEVVMEHIGN